jgi:hypothetical protein
VHHCHRTSKTDIIVFINFEHLVRHVLGIKNWKSEAPSSAGSNASKIDEFEDPCKGIWQKHWVMCSLKSSLDRLQRRSRTGITHWIGVRHGWINTYGKTISCATHGSYCCLHGLIWAERKICKRRDSDKVQWRRWWRWCKETIGQASHRA